jgi:hypothetical protein
MTILSVVYLQNGIAMAADSRFTNWDGAPYTLTDYAHKLFLLKNSSVGLSFTGTHLINGMTWSEVASNLDQDTVGLSITEIANNLYDKLYSNSTDIPQVGCYLAGYQDNEQFVYELIPNGIKQVNEKQKPDEENYGSTWMGNTQGVETFLPFLNPENNLSINDIADYAEFIVDTEIKYERFNNGYAMCGGPVDLLVITKDYAKFIKHKILQT